VNAPFSWPKSSLSRSDSASAAQFRRTNGAGAGSPRISASAMSSLPVPLSPVMSTLALLPDLRDQLEEREHLRVFGDDVPERVALAELLPEPSVLLEERAFSIARSTTTESTS
jgi:hypothetical protein